jgi:hypothetical protein
MGEVEGDQIGKYRETIVIFQLLLGKHHVSESHGEVRFEHLALTSSAHEEQCRNSATHSAASTL